MEDTNEGKNWNGYVAGIYISISWTGGDQGTLVPNSKSPAGCVSSWRRVGWGMGLVCLALFFFLEDKAEYDLGA